MSTFPKLIVSYNNSYNDSNITLKIIEESFFDITQMVKFNKTFFFILSSNYL